MWLIYSATGALGLSIAFGLITWAGFLLIYRQVRRQPFVIVGLGLALGALAHAFRDGAQVGIAVGVGPAGV